MPKRLIKYSCSYCNKFVQTKIEHVIKHESKCFFNPKNKACMTCKFCKRRLRKGDEIQKYHGFVWECLKKDIIMYSLQKSKINVCKKTNHIIIESDNQNWFNNTADRKKLIFPTINCSEYIKKTNKK